VAETQVIQTKKPSRAEEWAQMPRWLRDYYAGQQLGLRAPQVIFESKHLAIVKMPGNHYYGGQTDSSRGYRPYAQQHFDLVAKGTSWDRDPHRHRALHEGRITKDILARLKRTLDEVEAKLK
jgi:hypothetical protein